VCYVHRPPGAKVEYEKEIRRVATFGSVGPSDYKRSFTDLEQIESFLQIYSHLTPPNELPTVTDLLVFLARIGRPGVWEEMREYVVPHASYASHRRIPGIIAHAPLSGGKFTLRLIHPITPLLYESLLLSLIGDQFDEADAVVGCVLSVRQGEDILSVWVEEEGEGVRSGALRSVLFIIPTFLELMLLCREKILNLLSLPPTTLCEYRSNRALLDAATKPLPSETQPQPNDYQLHQRGQSHHPNQLHGPGRGGRDERNGWGAGNGFRGREG